MVATMFRPKGADGETKTVSAIFVADIEKAADEYGATCVKVAYTTYTETWYKIEGQWVVV